MADHAVKFIYGYAAFSRALEIKWGKLYFVEKVDTDLMLYRDRAYLALPSPGEENRFLMQATSLGIDFYIGSTSLSNYGMVGSFFSKLYGCVVFSDEPEYIHDSQALLLTNSLFTRNGRNPYFPIFLRNIAYLPSSMEGVTLQYEAIVRSSSTFTGRRKFNFCLIVRAGSDSADPEEVRSYVRNEVSRIRRENKWRMRIRKGIRGNFSPDRFYDPSLLSNFVRVPRDEGEI